MSGSTRFPVVFEKRPLLDAKEHLVTMKRESAAQAGGTEQRLKHARLRKIGEFRPGIFTERLRAARLAAHLTQEELAGERFSKSYISALERGKMVPSLQALTYLADTLEVPLSYLLGESPIDEGSLEDSTRV